MRTHLFPTLLTRIVEMSKRNVKRMALAGILAPVLVLCIQNLFIFFNHYFRDYGFPWDFPLGYYSIVAFWTSLTSQGYFPSWIPFQQMGFPIGLYLQSGFHYPLFWIFPIFKIQYTLHAAVIFQCLHILLGSIGMFLFLRVALKSNRYALLGAIAFQFFGGFYSNAEHPDIIRSFAFAPWLFYCFFIDKDIPKVSWRHTLIPVFILFVATGGYPGNFISSIFFMGVFVILQIAQLIYQKTDWKIIGKITMTILAMTILGAGLSFYHLGPGWLYRSYMIRSDGNVSYFSLGLEYFPGLFLNNDVFPTEISMTSTFITMPILLLVAYSSGKAIKKWWAMLLLGALAISMVAGPDSVVWYLVTKIVPPLRLSRFPSSDYRIFIAIPLIFFAVLGAKNFIDRNLAWKSFLLRTLLIGLLIFQGIYSSYLPVAASMGWLKIPPFILAIMMLGTVSLLMAFYYFSPNRNRFVTNLGVVMLVTSVLIDAYRVLPNMKTWQMPNNSAYYSLNNWPLEADSKLITTQLLQKSPKQRPARIVKNGLFDYSWEGYITGRYLYGDLVPFTLKSAHIIDAKPMYKDFMLKSWTPLLLDSRPVLENNVAVSESEFSPVLKSGSNEPNPGLIKQTSYGINTITYEVSLDEPQIFVENEIYFPGWRASLDFGDVITKIEAISANKVFRTWVLPAGKYHMIATFEFPYSNIYNGISIGSLLVWVALIFYSRIRGKTAKPIWSVVRSNIESGRETISSIQ